MKQFILTVSLLLMVRISFSQNVGIGTTTPAAHSRLDVKLASSGNFENVMIEAPKDSVGFGLLFKNPVSAWDIGTDIGNYFDSRFQITNEASVGGAGLTLMPNGFLGIGDFIGAGNTPLKALHIQTIGTGNFDGMLIQSPVSDEGYGIMYKNPTLSWFEGPNAGNYSDGRFRINNSTNYALGLTLMPNGFIGMGYFSAVGNVPLKTLHIQTNSSGNFDGMLIQNSATDQGFGITYKNTALSWFEGPNGGNYSDGRFRINNSTNYASGLILMPNGTTGIGDFSGVGDLPSAQLEIKSSKTHGLYSYTDSLAGGFAGTNYSTAPAGIKGEYRGANNNDGSGVLGVATSPNVSYGVGVSGIGSWYGVLGMGVPGGYSGMAAYADGASFALYCVGGLFLNGDFSGSGVTTYTSDRKLKKDIQPIGNALTIINQLKPSSYQFRVGEFGDMHLPSGKHYGLVAQDLQQVLPELVVEQKYIASNSKDKSFDYLSVNYNELIPVLISGIKEQQQEIDNLEKRVERLEKLLEK
jgi:hypothetical protein